MDDIVQEVHKMNDKAHKAHKWQMIEHMRYTSGG